MIFSQTVFFVFFAIFFALYLATARSLRLQNLLILGGSYVFYGWWDPRFLMLIAASTIVDYIAGLAIGGARIGRGDLARSAALIGGLMAILAGLGVANLGLILTFGAAFLAGTAAFVILTEGLAEERRRRVFLTTSVIFNLGMLGVFKYFNFFADSFADLAGLFGWQPGFVTLNVVLPVGISFYTFQTMSYTLDIYRRQLEPSRHFVEFAAFVSFFPQLVAGPIERARNLLPQFSVPRAVTFDGLQSGAMLFLWGFYKKVVIADNLAPIADRVFSDPAAAAPGEILVGVLAFTFQIYCDFSGYSDMARGTARMLGFNLMLNFNMPYFARTPSEFWQRWHISLSSWLRDYLYVPLGGNRGTALLTYRNLMLTMLLGGLWHGAAWTFVAWGLFHGLILVAYRLADADAALARVPATGPAGIALHGAAMAGMFLLVMLSWVFFRAGSFADAWTMLQGFWSFAPSETLDRVLFLIAPLVLFEAATRLFGRVYLWDDASRLLRFNLVLFLLYSGLFLGAPGGQNFIYFDF
jgi:D-alanyl-lipoteichoic acid acyltransferase DltB (MBOAT superfamily)